MKVINIISGMSLSISLGVLCVQVQANPSGAQVINGQVTFSQPNINTLQINNSNGSIINWQDFSINANELTHFQQSGANSAILNQVVGNNVSNIMGNLTSNGQVYLINQHGIIFGENSVVDTAGFIASTLNLSNQDFLQGKLNFEGYGAADILNHGFITAGADGDIALIAPNIINDGVIKVEQGNVILAAGEKVTLTSLSASDVGFEIQSADNTITNLGSVETDGGAIGMFAGSLTHSGVITANALALDEQGNVILVARSDLTVTDTAVVTANGDNGGRVLIKSETGTTLVSGDISVTGKNGTGGVIDVLGQQVGVLGDAILDASGTLGGGQIHVGGNYQGQGELQNAIATFVGSDALLSVDAIASGNGGEIIVWADDATRVYGLLSAAGGQIIGDGGFVETSGKQYLDVTGVKLKLGAVNGEGGTWLLDPVDITITTAVDSGTVVTPFPNFTSSTAVSNIDIITLENVLNTNASVTISTSGGTGGLGDITLDAGLVFNLGNTSALTLNADNDIVVTANGGVSVGNSSDLSLNFNAKNNIDINGSMVADASSKLTLNAVADSDASTVGAISLGSVITTNNGDVNLFAGSGIDLFETTDIQTLNGAVSLDTVSGNITLYATSGGASIQTSNGGITLQAQSPASNITLQAGAPSAQLISTGVGNINLIADEINSSGTISTTSVVTLKTFNSATPIQLVSTDFILAGNLIIGSDELANISGDLVIGSLANNSLIDINSPVVYSGGSNLALLTANNINFNQAAGTAIDVGANSINLRADKIADNSATLDLLAASIDIQTVNGAGIAFGGEIDTQTDALTFSNTTTGAVAISNSSATGLTISGTNTSADSGTSIQVDDSSPLMTLGNISGGANGDIGLTNFGGDLVVSDGAIISGGANAVQHLLSASGVITFGIGSSINNNNGVSEIVIDAADLVLDSGTIDALNGKVWINPYSAYDIGIGNGTIVSAGLVVNDVELANINAAALGFGNIATNIDIGTVIDLGVLGYDLFLSAGGALTFQTSSGINVSGGKLSLYSPNFDFTTNSPVIQGTGMLEFVNLLDSPSIELNASCVSQVGGVCVTQTNLDNLVDGFSNIRFSIGTVGGIEVNAAMTFKDSVEFDTTLSNGDININAPLDFGTNDIVMNTGAGAINFNQTSGTAGVLANNIFLAASTIINTNSSTLFDIVGNQLSFITDSGFGNSTKPMYTNINEVLSGVNTNAAFEIFIDNDQSLQVTSLSQGAGAGLSTTILANGDLIVGQINGGGNDVILDTTAASNGIGGAIIDNGVASPNINGAANVMLLAENDIGSMINPIELNAISGGPTFDSATGNIYINTVSGNLVFGSTDYMSGNIVNINIGGTGFIDDSAASSAVGGGTQIAQLTVTAVGNVNLTGAGNDAGQVFLTSTTGNVNYRDANDIVLAGAYATNNGTEFGTASGDVSIDSVAGAITDGNGGATNIVANNVYVYANTGIGMGDALETNISTYLDFWNNTSGSVEIFDIGAGALAINGVNNTLNIATTDFTEIHHENGVLSLASSSVLTSPVTDLLVFAKQVDIAATATLSSTLVTTALVLVTDELNIAVGGAVDSGTGDFAIETLSDGMAINLGNGIDNANVMDLSAAELAAITAGRISIGVFNQPVTGFSSGNIEFLGAINTGTADTRFVTGGDIIFNQGAVAAFTNVSVTGSEFNTQGAIVDLSTGTDIQATNILLVANAGIGNGNAIETQVSNLDVTNNASGNIEINNSGALTLVSAVQSAAADFILSNTADLIIPTISMAGGNVTLSSTGGQLLSDGTNPSITNATAVALNAANGIGTIVNPFILNQLGSGGLSASVTVAGNMYINNVNTGAVDFILAGLNINNGTAFINNLDSIIDTRVTGSVAGNGIATISSISDMQVDGTFNMSATGAVDLSATGAGSSVFVNSGSIRSVTGNISLLANTDIQLLGTADIQTTAPGLVTLTATNGQVFSDSTATISGGANLTASANTGIILSGSNDVGSLSFNTLSNNINFSDINDIFLDVIIAPTVGSSVTLTTAGAIIDANGVANNITAQTVSLNAANGIGTIADPIELSAQNYFNFSNSIANDVVVDNSVANSILLSGVNLGGDVRVSYDNTMQVLDVSALGNMILTSINGSIIDSNDAGSVALNLSAANIDLTAFTGIGSGNPIETQLTGPSGLINVNNTSTTLGNFEIENWAINATDVATFTANNLALYGTVSLSNPLGVMQAGNITSNQSFMELKALDLIVTGAVNNNDIAATDAILLVADDISFGGGSVNANNGDVEIYALTNGRAITLGAPDNSGNSLDLLQADANAISAARLSIGLMDTVTPRGSGDITIAGTFDVGAKDIRLQTLGNIRFSNGTSSGLATTALMELNADLAIIGDNSTGINLTASSLSLEANFGIGSTDAIRTQVTDLTTFNQYSNNLNISNTGALTVTDSANLAGSMSLSSDNTLTLTPFAALAGTTGAIAQADLTLSAASGLLVNGVVSAANINLLSANGVTINEVVTTTGSLVMNADTDANGIGDLIIENTNGGVLSVSAATMSVNAASATLQATSGPVHVESAGALNVVTSSNLNILGGDGTGFDAYLSASGDINMNIGGNLVLAGGTAANTAASIFDASGANANVLNMNIGGNAALNGGPGASSGAYISAGEVNMTVTGDMALTGSSANLSPAQVRGFGLNMTLNVGGNLTFIDGAGIGSLAQVISNNGLGYLQVSYLACSGCATGLSFLDQPIPNAATNEIVSTQNTSVITTDTSVSSADALLALLDDSTLAANDAEAAATAASDEDLAQQEAEPEAQLLVCR